MIGAAMEFYTYLNIFETKGLEYLLLMSFFVLFIFLVRYLSGPGREKSDPGEKLEASGRTAAFGKGAGRKSG
jgi:hypothetical protein